jgi:hypothetical protein
MFLDCLDWNFLSMEDTCCQAASALVFSKTSEKCSTLPAPLEAMTGIFRILLRKLSSRQDRQAEIEIIP